MLKRICIVGLFLIQAGCGFQTEPYEPVTMPQAAWQRDESKKRDFLKIEDVQIGDGPVAAWNRRIEAILDVRYTNGTVVFQGPTFYYDGFATMPDGGVYDSRHLSSRQEGIRLGNGPPRAYARGSLEYELCSSCKAGSSSHPRLYRRRLPAELTAWQSVADDALSLTLL